MSLCVYNLCRSPYYISPVSTNMSEVKSVSTRYREFGNEKYMLSKAEGINPTLKHERLDEALKLYNQAYQSASGRDEQASAAKNLAVASKAKAGLQSKFDQSQFFFKQAISYFDVSRMAGENCKDSNWRSIALTNLMECFDTAIASTASLDHRIKIAIHEEYINCLKNTEYKAHCLIELTEVIFHHAISKLQNKDYKLALSSIKDCHRPLQEALRLAPNNDNIVSEVQIHEHDCYIHQCIAESLQAIQIGDEVLALALDTEEVVLMTGIFDAMDWFRQAIIKTREQELEIEAIANSRMGVIYHRVIKRKDKAHDYFKRALDLAATLMPKNFAGNVWFDDATSGFKSLQDDLVKQETDEWAKKRTRYLDELKEELSILDKAQKEGELPYLKCVYKNYPPKKKQHVLKMPVDKECDLTEANKKKLLKDALIHYHPDKQKKHGLKWVVLCEEIAKHLTFYYERHK